MGRGGHTDPLIMNNFNVLETFFLVNEKYYFMLNKWLPLKSVKKSYSKLISEPICYNF